MRWRTFAGRNCSDICTEWNYDTNRGDNLCHKSTTQSKFLTSVHKNERRINEANDASIASAICGVKTEYTTLRHRKPAKNVSCYSDLFVLATYHRFWRCKTSAVTQYGVHYKGAQGLWYEVISGLMLIQRAQIHLMKRNNPIQNRTVITCISNPPLV